MIPLATAKAWLKIEDDEHDSDLQALLDRVSEFVEHDLDWYFREPRAKVEVLDGTGEHALYLRQPPVDAVAVEVRGTAAGDWDTIEASAYELDGRGLYARSPPWWTPGKRNYRATYDEGFDEVPGDIQQVVLDLVAAAWRARSGDMAGIKSERIGDYAYTLADIGELAGASRMWSSVRARWKRGRI
jgi:hypothetical protein